MERLIPDTTTPVEGWRFWSLSKKSGTLSSPFLSTPWPGRQAMRSECPRHRQEEKEELFEHCRCGLYALRSQRQLVAHYLNLTWEANCVFGEVSLWGLCIEGRNGFRAEFGYPKSLYLSRRLLHRWTEEELVEARDRLQARYGCPVEIIDGDHPLHRGIWPWRLINLLTLLLCLSAFGLSWLFRPPLWLFFPLAPVGVLLIISSLTGGVAPCLRSMQGAAQRQLSWLWRACRRFGR